MGFLRFDQNPLWVNLAVFAVAGALVWFAGVRLSRYAEEISERTGIGAAFIGALLLGGITSLPEVMTTVTAAWIGNAALAVNNLFGGVAMQVAVLAVADAAVRGEALSSVTAKPVVLLQGALLVFVLALAAAGMVLGEPATWPIGAWTPAIFLATLAGFYFIQRYEGEARWEPIMLEDERRRKAEKEEDGAEDGEGRGDGEKGGREDGKEGDEGAAALAMRRLALYTAAAAAAILVAGYALARTGDALATQTGLGSNFVGAALVAVATSLPEISTALAAARLGRYDMAFSNLYGANLLNVGLLFVADAVYGGAPVLSEMGDFALLGALLGILVTTVYLAGLITRGSRTVLRLGIDSILVLLLYFGGLFALYTLR